MKYVFVSLLLILMSQPLFADYIVSNTVNGCMNSVVSIDNNDHSNMFAVFVPKQYTCSSGQYLPANTDGCRTCPISGICNGGLYTFNESYSQGIELSYPLYTQSQTNTCVREAIGIDNNHSNIFAIFTPNQHTCSSGYYLPAGVDECTICPMNSVCSGGMYAFNETTDQGIQSCASGTFAPTGSAVCYPHIFHVGDDVVYLKTTKQTTPSLNVKIGNDMFYANMTTVRTKMNKDSDHYFHAQWENNDYYICDDTTCPQ